MEQQKNLHSDITPARPGALSRDDSISMARLIALLLIITCHFFQVLEIELAYWFNVGVQVFLCISGFLYGKKEIGNVTGFYLSRLKKILIPYYIAFIPFCIVYFLFARNLFSLNAFLRGLICDATLDGSGHLWFVPVILMCYLLTPLLQAFQARYAGNGKTLIWYTLVASAAIFITFGAFAGYYNPAWIICYTLGYALGVNDTKKYLSEKPIFAVFLLLAVIGNGIQILCDYVLPISMTGLFKLCYSVFSRFNHVFLGVFLFLLFHRFFRHTQFRGAMRKALSISDRYSYEVYLVHLFVIKGPFSMLGITRFLPLNIVLTLIMIVVLTCLVKGIEQIVFRALDRRKPKASENGV